MGAGKKKIWIRGQFIEVTDEVYTAYMKGDRKIRYFENDLKTERTVKDKDGNIKQIFPSREDSLDRLMEDNAQQFPDSHESVEDIVIQKISLEKLHIETVALFVCFLKKIIIWRSRQTGNIRRPCILACHSASLSVRFWPAVLL